jgi:hypothetical protein
MIHHRLNLTEFLRCLQDPKYGLFARSHTIRRARTHPIGLRTSDQLVAEATTYSTQQTQQTNIHVLSGIRTRHPSN